MAIYWSRWNIWTLVLIDKFPTSNGDRRSITMLQAMKMNEMATLGDLMIGTLPPLVLRMIADPNGPRTVGKNGQGLFRIGNVELYSVDTKIDDPTERNIAFYIMLYGEWPVDEPQALVRDNRLLAVDFRAAPTDTTPGQGFEFVGSLSGMISHRYNDLTATEDGVERLSPAVQPGSLGILLNRDYKGRFLPLWRLSVQPDYAATAA